LKEWQDKKPSCGLSREGRKEERKKAAASGARVNGVHGRTGFCAFTRGAATYHFVPVSGGGASGFRRKVRGETI